MATFKVKLSRRFAERELHNHSCRVKVDGKIYKTKKGIKGEGDKRYVIGVIEYQIPLEEIEELEHTERFGLTHFEGVKWND